MTHWTETEWHWLRADLGVARETDRRATSEVMDRRRGDPIYSDQFDGDRLIEEMVRLRDGQTSYSDS
jgi:hypothetical protein